MIHAARVTLRARHPEDLPILFDELYRDVEVRSRADTRPWVPIPPDTEKHPYATDDGPSSVACFSVVARDDGSLLGEALLWQIDLHNRTAHLGLSLRPGARGNGYGADVVAGLCDYGFRVRGLARLQIETLVDNVAMRKAAEANGFVHEGTLRAAAYVLGERIDEVLYGLLASGWTGLSGRDATAAP